MGNTDKFEMIANVYDTHERIQIANVSSDAIREYLVDPTGKSAIDFGCGTVLVGLNLVKRRFLSAAQKRRRFARSRCCACGRKRERRGVVCRAVAVSISLDQSIKPRSSCMISKSWDVRPCCQSLHVIQ
jgi:hypothetical protein